jgi:Zn-finger nucleic acid-binding protein
MWEKIKALFGFAIVTPEPKPEPKPEPQPQPKPEPQPEPKPEPQPEPKPEPQPEPKPEPQPQPKPEPQPEPKPEPQQTPPPKPPTTPKKMKICPRSGEQMKEVEILGEKVDISSKGCYFDRGELTRILGSKPTFLQSVSNFYRTSGLFKIGSTDPRKTVDSGIEHLRLDQEILECKNKIQSSEPGSFVFNEAVKDLEKLQKQRNSL